MAQSLQTFLNGLTEKSARTETCYRLNELGLFVIVVSIKQKTKQNKKTPQDIDDSPFLVPAGCQKEKALDLHVDYTGINILSLALPSHRLEIISHVNLNNYLNQTIAQFLFLFFFQWLRLFPKAGRGFSYITLS